MLQALFIIQKTGGKTSHRNAPLNRMDHTRGVTVRLRENDGMLKRLWKKLKGSHDDVEPCNENPKGDGASEEGETEAEMSPVSDPESHPGQEGNDLDYATNEPKQELPAKGDVVEELTKGLELEAGDEADDDYSVSSSDSDSSSSSSESYCSISENDMIVVPTRKMGDRETSPTKSDVTPTSNSQETDNILQADENSARLVERPHFDLKLLAATQFPEFEWENPPDLELTDGSDDDSTVRKKEEAYATKEDQDVAVFMDIAKRLPMKSLLHLLQGHVHSQQSLPSDYVDHYNEALAKEGEEVKAKPSSLKVADGTKKPFARKKQFRWAEVTDEKVRSVVHVIESAKEYKEMWWSPEEMHTIRTDLIEVVQFFRRRRPNYISSVEIVARGNQEESVMEDHMKQLMADSFPRGLETHIVKMLSDHRKSTIQAVLEEQKECKMCNDGPETTMHCIREQSLAYSQISTRFATNMGKCDEIDALKAGISRWRATPAPADADFFTP